MRRDGILVGAAPTLIEICTALSAALDRVARLTRRRTDLSEIAYLCAVESLYAITSREIPSLFATAQTPEETRGALGRLATAKQFGVLAHDFFARLTRRYLDYFLSRELPNHIGVRERFHSLREHRTFENALDVHCRETAVIMQEFAGSWFSATNYMGGIDEGAAGRFAFVAFDKLRRELEVRRDAVA